MDTERGSWAVKQIDDFDNAGLADPSQQLAVAVDEYGAEPGRAGLIRAAYAEAGGPGRVEHATDFALAIAQPSHNEGCVREFVDQPLTRAGSRRSWRTEPGPSVQGPERSGRERPIRQWGGHG